MNFPDWLTYLNVGSIDGSLGLFNSCIKTECLVQNLYVIVNGFGNANHHHLQLAGLTLPSWPKKGLKLAFYFHRGGKESCHHACRLSIVMKIMQQTLDLWNQSSIIDWYSLSHKWQMLQHVTHFHQSQRTCWSSNPVKSAPQKKKAHFQSFEEISQTCMPVQRCLMKLLLIFDTKENNEKKDWTKWKLSILERCRRVCVCGFWFCDRKFVHDVIQRWTASWNTQKAAPDHIYALYNLAAQLIPTKGRNYSFTLQEKILPKFSDSHNSKPTQNTFLYPWRERYTIMGGYFLSAKPRNPYWRPKISFTP